MTAEAQPRAALAVRSASRRILPFAAVAVLLAVGCSTNDPEEPTFEVTGEITINGRPMPRGTITFVPYDADAEGADGVTGEITNGTYSVRVPAGKQRVQFRMPKMVRLKGGDGGTEPVEALPPRFNSESEIATEVSASENNEFNYQIRSR